MTTRVNTRILIEKYEALNRESSHSKTAPPGAQKTSAVAIQAIQIVNALPLTPKKATLIEAPVKMLAVNVDMGKSAKKTSLKSSASLRTFPKHVAFEDTAHRIHCQKLDKGLLPEEECSLSTPLFWDEKPEPLHDVGAPNRRSLLRTRSGRRACEPSETISQLDARTAHSIAEECAYDLSLENSGEQHSDYWWIASLKQLKGCTTNLS